MWPWPPRRLPAPERLLAALLLLLAAACTEPLPPGGSGAAAVSAPRTGYVEALADLERQQAQLRAQVTRYPDSWVLLEQVVLLQLRLLQLTGDYRHFREAAAALTEAETRAGPAVAALCATQAQLAFDQHRIAEAASRLNHCTASSHEARARLADIGAEIPFFQGDYPAAFAAHRSLLAEQSSISIMVRLSHLHFVSGHREEALALLDRAERSHHAGDAHLKAWLLLQRAIIELESGRWEDARAWLLAADRAFPGWWLIREHLAEIHALLGDEQTALREYADVIRDTNNPEHMDAMAKLLRERGDEAAARPWIAAASKLYALRLASWPEASYGHALDHFLRFGTAAESLAMARKNHALRPNGESQIKLCRALLRTGDHAEAVRVIRRALASDWNTAELHAVAAQVFAAAGLAQQAQAQTAIAKAINPHAAQQYAPIAAAPAPAPAPAD